MTVQDYCIKHGQQDFIDTGEGICCPLCCPDIAKRDSEFFVINVTACFDSAEGSSYGSVRAAVDASFERQFVNNMLRRHHGNISAAAREAKMDRRYFCELRKKHGIEKSVG
jgi:DNA-binding NtrC family response regulator